jgi:hypothetical protein
MQARMITDSSEPDRRSARRNRTLKGARIVFNAGFSAFECTVRDLTPDGAKLQLGEATGVPNHFELELEHGQPRRKCTVRWRAGLTIGVSFDDSK